MVDQIYAHGQDHDAQVIERYYGYIENTDFKQL